MTNEEFDALTYRVTEAKSVKAQITKVEYNIRQLTAAIDIRDYKVFMEVSFRTGNSQVCLLHDDYSNISKEDVFVHMATSILKALICWKAELEERFKTL